jgi:putative ABC transport system permease protein
MSRTSPPGTLRTAARTLRAHRLRFAIPALAVLLGVAFVTGSLIYSHSVKAAAAEAAAEAAADVSVRIEPDDSTAGRRTGPAPRLDQALLRRLRAVPGAAAARGTAEGRSFLVGSDGELVGNLDQSAGVNYVAGASGKDPRYPLTAGRAPRTSREVAIDRQTAERTGLRVGGRTRVVVQGKVREARMVGVLTAHDSRLYQGGTLTAFDTATAQRQFALAPKTYTALTLTAARGTSEARLAHAAGKVLPRGLRAVSASDEVSQLASQDDQKTTTLLLGFAGIALFVSTFLIASTFTMLSAARAREHALLRALGATRGYVLR